MMSSSPNAALCLADVASERLLRQNLMRQPRSPRLTHLPLPQSIGSGGRLVELELFWGSQLIASYEGTLKNTKLTVVANTTLKT